MCLCFIPVAYCLVLKLSLHKICVSCINMFVLCMYICSLFFCLVNYYWSWIFCNTRFTSFVLSFTENSTSSLHLFHNKVAVNSINKQNAVMKESCRIMQWSLDI